MRPHANTVQKVPRLIRHTAKEMAGEHFNASRSPEFRAQFPKEMDYVNMNWPLFVPTVRATFSSLLGDPKISESVKRPIYEAILEDQANRTLYVEGQQ